MQITGQQTFKECSYKNILSSLFFLCSADERFDATFHTNVLVNASGSCQYIPPGINYSYHYINHTNMFVFFIIFFNIFFLAVFHSVHEQYQTLQPATSHLQPNHSHADTEQYHTATWWQQFDGTNVYINKKQQQSVLKKFSVTYITPVHW